ncbi:hypothetical protein ABZX92_27415 [Lentzea sp. NPDC006480]|uniref:hypothetical protein n=1 Tax=Lentzea sp. NPDC006480 TaxID=3157176 RepID=UPI0033BB4CD0
MGRIAALVLILVAVAACGNNEEGTVLTTTPVAAPLTTPMNDPVLTKAADVVQPLLEKEFADSYAGLEIRHDVPMVVVYRKPDPRLDEEVRRVAPDARIEFRDASYTRAEMAEHVERVMDDREYWQGRGITIVQAGPAVDGSGVEVGVQAPPPGDFARQLDAYYPAMSFKLTTTGKIVDAPYTGPVPVYPST